MKKSTDRLVGIGALLFMGAVVFIGTNRDMQVKAMPTPTPVASVQQVQPVLSKEEQDKKDRLARQDRLDSIARAEANEQLRLNKIKESSLSIGMTVEEMKLCENGRFSKPSDINTYENIYGKQTQYCYGIGTYIYIENGIVTGISR